MKGEDEYKKKFYRTHPQNRTNQVVPTNPFSPHIQFSYLVLHSSERVKNLKILDGVLLITTERDHLAYHF